MAKFTRSDNLRGAEFTGVDLSDARFVSADLGGVRIVGSDLPGVVMRAVEVQNMEIDAPWLFEGENFLQVNGVNVIPLVDAELNRRFPGRAERHAADPGGLRSAWAALERAWANVLERVDAMPAGTVDISIAGEWSFSQTLRHLIMATDTWLGRAVMRLEHPYHPIGQPDTASAAAGNGDAVFRHDIPDYADVLDVRAGRVAMVRDYLASITADDLAAERRNPHNPSYPETVLSCLHTIFEEEWEHQRYAVRDLDAIAAGSDEHGR